MPGGLQPMIRWSRRKETLVKNAKFSLLGLLVGTLMSGAVLAQDGLPDRLIAGADFDFRPSTIQGPDGTITGEAPDIVAALSERIGIPIEFQGMAWDGIIPSLQTGRIDMIAGMVITPERQAAVQFTDPLNQGTVVMVVSKDWEGELPTAATLANYRIGGQVNSYSSTVIAEVAPDADTTLFTSVIDAYNELLLGRVDVVVIESASGSYIAMTAFPDQLMMLDEQVGEGGSLSGFAIRQGEPELLELLNTAFDEMRADGTLAEIRQRWYGTSADVITEIQE